MFFKKKAINLEPTSPGKLTWMRFKKNKPAMFGLFIIAVACTVSVLGYLITPDKTPYANTQKPELRILSPGASIKLLLVKRKGPNERVGWMRRMLFGEINSHTSYSVYNYQFFGPDIVIEEYTGSVPNNGEKLRFNLADVVCNIKQDTRPVVDSVKQTISFYEEGSAKQVIKMITELRQEVTVSNFVTKTYLLGTDILGRDLLSRLLIGTRVSLGVGLIAVVISMFIGILLGSVAGYFRGVTDAAIMWLVNVVWSIPTILLVIAITLVLGKGVTQVFIAVGLTMWVDVARLVRGQVLSIREKEFVEAGRALGYSNARIILKHILPNIMGPVIVAAAGNFATAILTEAGLSFLGLGTQPPMPSWGEMTNAHRGYILMDKAYLAFIPGVAIMLLVLSFMLAGNGLRDAMDTRATNDKPLVNV